MSDKRAERFNQIISILRQQSGASIKDLAEQLDVSPMTVRRDLEALEGQGVVTLFHGSVVYNENDGNSDFGKEPDYAAMIAATSHAAEKRRIGRKAAELINPEDVVIIDSGTTAEALARAIPEDMPLTLLCCSLNVLQVIAPRPHVRVLVAGGRYHPDTQMFESLEGIAFIERNRALKAFVSAAGINSELGVTCLYEYERNTKVAILKHALTKILIADSSKFGKVLPVFFADYHDFDILVTDDKLSQADTAPLEEAGVKVLKA
ncbi:MAG TPA: DeoR/GlpR family DNA-binding transcription regulator [Anaerolineae bacterium]|nr:DeoR/GlpR family DNA-binding transcription regulator [Anaerolineae bacterium]HMR68414.1 DeoR/GlpR family DNA-binding transcription regulator [Anaerolineae bacterium]